jgi:homoserine kinase
LLQSLGALHSSLIQVRGARASPLDFFTMQEVTVRLPASTSNLGPGFDCLGVALRIYNHVTLRRGEKSRLPRMAAGAAKLFFEHVAGKTFPLSCSISGEIPAARGLGASATIRLGVLHGLNELSDRSLDRLSIFRLCAQLEGHADNAAPSSFGGFTVVRGATVQHFPVSPRVHFVLLVSDLEIKTAVARKILPRQIGRLQAVESCGNACMIAAAFAAGEYEKLRGAFADRLHQPFRAKLMPFLPRVIAAAEKAGALGAFLSGSGSAICAVTLQDRHHVAAAMLRAARPTSAKIIMTTADNRGLQISNQKSAINNQNAALA